MRTILFDIDGTLLTTHGGGSSALRQAMSDVFDLADPAANIQFSGRSYVMTENFQDTGRHKLENFGLDEFFRGIFGGDHDSDRNQSARRTANTIVARYGPSALDDVIVVGDTVADIRCGHWIGAKVIAVCTGGQNRQQLETESPLAVLDDLNDLSEILRWLLH